MYKQTLLARHFLRFTIHLHACNAYTDSAQCICSKVCIKSNLITSAYHLLHNTPSMANSIK